MTDPATPSGAAPVADGERILALDVLRGFALLGILIMNVQAFAMPGSAYLNPASYGSLAGIDGVVWAISHLLADQKLMTIFSLLFGAGVCLFCERAEARTGRSAAPYYRRTIALLLVGVAHGYLLFHGDVLMAYGTCGLWVYLMRNRRPRTLAIVGFGLLCVPPAIMLLAGLALPEMPPAQVAEITHGWAPSPAELEAEVAGMTGSLAEQLATRAPQTLALQTFVFCVFFVWRVSAMMLLGMALYKTGVVTGARSRRFYLGLAGVTLPVGLGLAGWGVSLNFAHGWSTGFSMFLGSLPNYWASALVALGYIGLVLAAVQAGLWAGLARRLAAVGRMAFTNYIAHSLLAVLTFNVGGLFGAVTRSQQLLFVAGVWALQLAWSPWWLARFRYGPLEWLWRAVTYGRRPPMRR